jgi:hypothetical protein
VERIGQAMIAAGFAPDSLFADSRGHDPSVLRIVRSDAYGRPIYSIAIREGCLEEEEPRSEQCRTRLTARMVRAPAPQTGAAAGQRARQLAEQLVRRRATTVRTIRIAFRSMALEWSQADLRSCPGAVEKLAGAASVTWLPRRVEQTESNPAIWLDSDSVEVTFDYYPTRSVFSGVPIDGSPGAWAKGLARVLEPCWKSARTPPPWMR